MQSVLVCLFRCFLIPPASAWFTLDQSDPFRFVSTGGGFILENLELEKKQKKSKKKAN